MFENNVVYAFLDYLFAGVIQRISKSVNERDLYDRNNDTTLYELTNCIFDKELKESLFHNIYKMYSFCDTQKRNSEKNKYHFNKVIIALESNFFDIKDEIVTIVFETMYSKLQEELFKWKGMNIRERLLLNESIKRAVSTSIEVSFLISCPERIHSISVHEKV